jgi:hypothetical protein
MVEAADLHAHVEENGLLLAEFVLGARDARKHLRDPAPRHRRALAVDISTVAAGRSVLAAVAIFEVPRTPTMRKNALN